MWLIHRTCSTVDNCNGYDCKYANIHIVVNDYDKRLVSIPISQFSSNLGRNQYTFSSTSTVMSRICHTILMRLKDMSFFYYSPWTCSRPRESFRLIAKRISIMLSDNAHTEDYCYNKFSNSSHVLENISGVKSMTFQISIISKNIFTQNCLQINTVFFKTERHHSSLVWLTQRNVLPCLAPSCSVLCGPKETTAFIILTVNNTGCG